MLIKRGADVAQDCKPGTLPTIIHSSMGTVVILFLCANISYFLVLPFTVVSLFIVLTWSDRALIDCFDQATATSTIGELDLEISASH